MLSKLRLEQQAMKVQLEEKVCGVRGRPWNIFSRAVRQNVWWTIFNFYVRLDAVKKNIALEICHVRQSYTSVRLIHSGRTNYNINFTGVGQNVR